jgi:Arc/MetJ family transcription regulator
MSRTNIDLDDEALADVMRVYRFATKRDAVNFALNKVRRRPMTLEEARAMEGVGYDGDINEIKDGSAVREF